MSVSTTEDVQAKPFIKWAGGKTQLLPQLRDRLPVELADGVVRRYVEPFLGGGAVFIDIAQTYHPESILLNDINPELVLVYKVVQQNPSDLVTLLDELSSSYYRKDTEQRSPFYYSIRDKYNDQLNHIDFDRYSDIWIKRAAYMIFLNKTCFNGLFRVNSSGQFNVPFGRYRKPIISDPDNIFLVSDLLSRATITCEAFTKSEQYIDDHSFVYFDPPYRPLSETSSFTSYSKSKFDDHEQKELGQYFSRLDSRYAAKLMLSNSDPKNTDPNDTFFDDLYRGFTIERVYANRMINSNGNGRGKITEILVTNY